MNSLGAEWRTDLQIGRTSRLRTEFYQPLGDAQRLFVAPSARPSGAARPLPGRRAHRELRHGPLCGSASTSAPSSPASARSRLGLAGGTLRPKLESGRRVARARRRASTRRGVTFRAVFDQLDNVELPARGLRREPDVFASSPRLGARDDYTRWDLYAHRRDVLGRHTLIAGGRVAGALDRDPAGLRPRAVGRLPAAVGLPGRRADRPGAGRSAASSTPTGWPTRSCSTASYVGSQREVGRMAKTLVPGNRRNARFRVRSSSASTRRSGPSTWPRGGDRRHSSAYVFLGRP